MKTTAENETGREFTAQRDPYLALRHRDFRLLLVGQMMSAFGNRMLSFAIGLELWLRTHDELAIGLVGLVQVIPVIVLSLPAGHVADHYNRKRIIVFTQTLLAICSLGLAALSITEGSLVLVYLCLFGIGVARAFNTPAASTLLPTTVPPEVFTSAATWMSSSWQIASIIGPAFAGWLVVQLGTVAELYALDAVAAIIFLGVVLAIKGRPLALSKKAATLDSLKEGIRFILNTKVLLAAITLDLFAVLFGGAVALLPIYALDILKVGEEGLGWLSAAPSVGALIMAVFIARFVVFRHAGRTLLIAVAGFGVATIIFGLSTSFWLSMLMLFTLGALDNISVVIRSTLVLTLTPDEMRGRTSAVNSIFIGASNELGSFESGFTARLFGPVLAVIGGGIGTILVVVAVARNWSELRQLKTLDAPEKFKVA